MAPQYARTTLGELRPPQIQNPRTMWCQSNESVEWRLSKNHGEQVFPISLPRSRETWRCFARIQLCQNVGREPFRVCYGSPNRTVDIQHKSPANEKQNQKEKLEAQIGVTKERLAAIEQQLPSYWRRVKMLENHYTILEELFSSASSVLKEILDETPLYWEKLVVLPSSDPLTVDYSNKTVAQPRIWTTRKRTTSPRQKGRFAPTIDHIYCNIFLFSSWPGDGPPESESSTNALGYDSEDIYESDNELAENLIRKVLNLHPPAANK